MRYGNTWLGILPVKSTRVCGIDRVFARISCTPGVTIPETASPTRYSTGPPEAYLVPKMVCASVIHSGDTGQLHRQACELIFASSVNPSGMNKHRHMCTTWTSLGGLYGFFTVEDHYSLLRRLQSVWRLGSISKDIPLISTDRSSLSTA